MELGDVDQHRDLLPVPGNDLRPVRLRGAQQFAEPLLRLLHLPEHDLLNAASV
jgi:hypothetical protein